MSADLSLISELATAAISSGRRTAILQHVTDLFIVGAPQLSEKEILLFDDVISRLAVEIEVAARAFLAVRLAPIPNAPPRTIRALAFDDAIEVAGPVLSQSERLDDSTLVANAQLKGQEHMLAISRRKVLGEVVTDILVARGDQQVLLSTTQNRGAKFSDSGYNLLVTRSDGDETLAICVGEREDIAPHLFRQLLEKASARARARLEAAHPNLSGVIRQTIAEVSNRIELETLERSAVSIADGLSFEPVDKLNDARLSKLAQNGTLTDVSAALANMCQLPFVFVENAMKQRRSETLLLIAKAHVLSWPTTKAILELRARNGLILHNEIDQCLAGYERIEPKTACEILHFYRVREKHSDKRHTFAPTRG
jgi:uncharacterized protein (DUF2336 family)